MSRYRTLGRHVCASLLFFAASACDSPNARVSERGTLSLTVTVRGAQSESPALIVALFNSESAFPNGPALREHHIPVSSDGTGIAVFQGLWSGIYAVRAYGDANGNGTFDQTPFGLPRERVGYSNNREDGTTLPSFTRAQVELTTDMTIEIDLLDWS